MRKLVALGIFFSMLKAAGQVTGTNDLAFTPKDTLANPRYSNSQEAYSPLYNGRQFYGYPSTIEGHAFYLLKDFSKGSLLFDGTWYNDVQLMYDIYRDEVIIKHPNGIPLILFSDRVKQFTFQGLTFVNLTNDTINKIGGFYQQLASGRATLLVKRVKKLEEKIDGQQLERKFYQADVFYILKDNRYHTVNNQPSLLNALKERRPALQQYRRQAGLRYKADPEQFVHRLTSHYNQLNP